jgi:hypothetical protein
MTGSGDDDLRRLFDEARRADEEKAPPFRIVLGRPGSRARVERIPLGILAAAAAILAFAVSLALFRPEPPAPIRIADWRSPTDFLLAPPYPDLFGSPPSLPEPVPDYSPLLASQKGVTP